MINQLGTLFAGVAAETPPSWTSEEPMPMLEVLGLYVGLPVALFLVIAILASKSAWTGKASTQRAGLSWWAAPQWFGARPADKDGDAPAEGERGGVGARW